MRRNLLPIRGTLAIVYGRVATLKDQLIMIASTLAWVSVEKVGGGVCPQCSGGSTTYVRMVWYVPVAEKGLMQWHG